MDQNIPGDSSDAIQEDTDAEARLAQGAEQATGNCGTLTYRCRHCLIGLERAEPKEGRQE